MPLFCWFNKMGGYIMNIMNRYLIRVDEALIKSFIKIQKSANKIYGCSSGSEIFDKVEKTMGDSCSEIVANMDIDELNAILLDTFPYGMSGMIDYDSIKKVGVKISEIVSDYAVYVEKPHQVSKIDFSPIFIREFLNSNLFKDSINVAYIMARRKLDQIGNEVNESELRFANIEELEDAVNGNIGNPKVFHEKYIDWPLEKKIQYCIINQILCFLCACYIRPYIQGNIGSPVIVHKASNVKRMPHAGADVSFQLKKSAEAIILEDTIHYYRIAFIGENCTKREGYVTKKSVKLLHEEEYVIK